MPESGELRVFSPEQDISGMLLASPSVKQVQHLSLNFIRDSARGSLQACFPTARELRAAGVRYVFIWLGKIKRIIFHDT